VQKLVGDVIAALGATVDAGVRTAEERMCEFSFLTTGDERVDGLLGGGIPTGCLTEVSGERYDMLDHVNAVVLESHSCVYSCVSTFNSLGH
jgi:Rad51